MNRQKMITAGKKLVRHELVVADGGNLSSFDVDKNEITITRSGVRLDELDVDSFVSFKLNQQEIPEQASSETAIHVAAYKTRPDFTTLLHFHPQHAILLVTAGIQIKKIAVDHAYYLENMTTLPFIQPGTAELALACGKQFEAGFEILLLAHHGCLLGSNSLDWGINAALNLEQAAKLTMMQRQLNLPANQIIECPDSYLKSINKNSVVS